MNERQLARILFLVHLGLFTTVVILGARPAELPPPDVVLWSCQRSRTVMACSRLRRWSAWA